MCTWYRCVGNALSLKSKYGKGYRINVVADPVDTPAVVAAVRTYAPCTSVHVCGVSRLFDAMRC